MRKLNSNRLRQIWQHLHLFDDVLTLTVAGLDEPRLAVTSGSENSNLFVAVPAHGVDVVVWFGSNITLLSKLKYDKFAILHSFTEVFLFTMSIENGIEHGT